MRKPIFLTTVLFVTSIAAAAPALGGDVGYPDREYRQLQRLERQHDRVDYRLQRQDAAAHRYGVSPRGDSRLHRNLARQERRVHRGIEQRYARGHGRYW